MNLITNGAYIWMRSLKGGKGKESIQHGNATYPYAHG